VEEATSAVVSVTFRRSRLAPLVTEVYISLVSHESLTERALQFRAVGLSDSLWPGPASAGAVVT
jgi:hypothetical protein